MSPKDLAETLQALLPTKRPLFVWGPPGVGKSDIIHQAAKKLSLDVLDLRAVLLDPVDLRGLPHINGDKRAIWCPPAFMPIAGTMAGRKGIIFADELPQAPPLVQAAFLQGILDHRIGEVELDRDWQWVAAGNRTEDRAGSHRIITPLLNRFGHLDLEVDKDQWNEWAAQNGIVPEVRMFMNWKPELLHKFDPSSHERAFPTPRSWAFVSQVARHAPPRLLHQVVAGFVGAGPAVEYVAFHRTFHELPDIDALLKNPASFKKPTDPAIAYSLCGAMSEKAKNATVKILAAIHDIVDQMDDEYAVLCIRDATYFNKDILQPKKVPAAETFIKKHRKAMANLS